MRLDHIFYDGETKARSSGLASPVTSHAVESLEHMFLIRQRNAGTVVPEADRQITARGEGGNDDLGGVR